MPVYDIADAVEVPGGGLEFREKAAINIGSTRPTVIKASPDMKVARYAIVICYPIVPFGPTIQQLEYVSEAVLRAYTPAYRIVKDEQVQRGDEVWHFLIALPVEG